MCLLERDPATYNIVTLHPLSSVCHDLISTLEEPIVDDFFWHYQKLMTKWPPLAW